MQRPKRNQQNESTTRLPRQKNIEQKKSQLSHKVMLTDLCPEEKAKIGELIKTLQQRKRQNQDLHEQLNSWKSNYLTLQKVKLQLQNLIDSKNKQIRRFTEELQKLSKQTLQKDIQLHEMAIQLQKYEKQKKSTKLSSIGTSTVSIQTKSQQTQTKQKRKKQKDRKIQVNTFQQLVEESRLKNNFYQPNSKSFDKIMKGQRLLQSQRKNHQTAVFREGQFDGSFRGKQFNGRNLVQREMRQQSSPHIEETQFSAQQNSRLKPEQLSEENAPNYWSSFQDDENQDNQVFNENNRKSIKSKPMQQIQVEDTQNEDDQFEMLARKWLQLKQKNIQQLSRGFYVGENEQFSSNLKSLKVESKVKSKNSVQKFEQNQQEEEQAIDQNQLNRALKSKDFSASRLLNHSRSKRNVSENSDKKSLSNSHGSYNQQNVNTKYQGRNLQNTLSSLNIKKKGSINDEKGLAQPPKPKNFMQGSKGPIVYNSDLLDLVQEINK